MNYNYIEMGNRIKLRRQELKIKQYELASSINISDNHMSSIERGCEKPSMDKFIAICEYLKVSPDYLVLGEMHPRNVPLNILDKLQLCSDEDVELAQEFVELLVKRNSKNYLINKTNIFTLYYVISF